MKNQQQYFSAQDLSARYSVSVQTIWYWRKKGALPNSIKIGKNSTRWTLDAIQKFEADRNMEG